MTTNEILVLGGTGKTGRRIAARLTRAGLTPRIGSRSADPSFDWEDETTWAPAVQGVTCLYLSYQPDLAVPGAPAKVEALARLATSSGVRRLVLLSGRGEPEAQESEELVREAAEAAGAEWTVVRAAWFLQNFSEAFIAEGVAAGEVVLPVEEVLEPFVDAEDIADVAVAALTAPLDGSSRHHGQVYEVTGPELLTFPGVTASIGSATGRSIAFVPVPLEAYVEQLRGYGLPEGETALIAYLFGEVLDGRNSSLADGVQRALGRPARGLGDYLATAFAEVRS